MLWKTVQRDARLLLAASCALVLICGGVALAAENWVDEVRNMVTFEKASYPGSDFDPYLQKLDRIQTGLDREDQHIVKMETDRFLKMLAERNSGRLLGAQIVGQDGSAKRIDVVATALHNAMTVEEMTHLDLSYAPPFATVWDPVLVAARKAAAAVAEADEIR